MAGPDFAIRPRRCRPNDTRLPDAGLPDAAVARLCGGRRAAISGATEHRLSHAERRLRRLRQLWRLWRERRAIRHLRLPGAADAAIPGRGLGPPPRLWHRRVVLM